MCAKSLPILFAALLCLALSVPCSAHAETAATTQKKDVAKLLEDAYIYTLPLVMMAATRDAATNVIEPTAKQAPVNQLHHAEHLVSDSFREVVTPNVDTLYSQAFLDLSQGPLVFVKPASDRYCSAQFLDGWTNTAAIAGTGGAFPDAQAEQVLLLLRADDKRAIPAGMLPVRFSGDLGWIIARTLCKGEDDVANVRALQAGFRLLPLDAYLAGGTYVPARGSHDPAKDFVPVKHVHGMSAQEFFDVANAQMAANPPALEDTALVRELKTIGVGPGLAFDSAVLGQAGASWQGLVQKAQARAARESRKFNVNWGPWQYMGEPIGEFGVEYGYRAMVSLRGLGANPNSAAIYASADKDSEGKPLRAGARYRLRFAKDALPPVKKLGFWSVTAYGDDNFLISNPLNRYCINDRSPVRPNPDGSLELLLQAGAPDGADAANWLPTGQGGFHLFLRIYLPDMAAIQGGWQAPSILPVVADEEKARGKASDGNSGN